MTHEGVSAGIKYLVLSVHLMCNIISYRDLVSEVSGIRDETLPKGVLSIPSTSSMRARISSPLGPSLPVLTVGFHAVRPGAAICMRLSDVHSRAGMGMLQMGIEVFERGGDG